MKTECRTTEDVSLITSSHPNIPTSTSTTYFIDQCLHDRCASFYSSQKKISFIPSLLERLSEMEAHYKRIVDIEKILFPQLVIRLNRYHCLEYSERYWKIVLGHWFRRHIETTYNRYLKLNRALTYASPSEVFFVDPSDFNFAGLTSLQYIRSASDDNWNSAYYACIFFRLNLTGPTINLLSPYIRTPELATPGKTSQNHKRSSLKKKLLNILSSLSGFARSDDGITIINSYLPPLSQALLYIKLHQLPVIYRSPSNFEIAAPDPFAREVFTSTFLPNSFSGVEQIIWELIPVCLPSCYLEGFRHLRDIASNIPWPLAPRCIFTSNNYDTDEVFKVWTAQKTTHHKSLYVIGQHGNNFGVSRFFNPSVEETICDLFITWGWSYESRHRPAFILKEPQIKYCKPTFGTSNLLYVQDAYPAQVRFYDVQDLYARSLNNHIIFASQLDFLPRKNLLIRLHPDHVSSKHDEVSRWRSFDNSIRFTTTSSISKDLSSTRIVVYGYDSTGLLESLFRNRICIAIMQTSMDFIRDECLSIYHLLIDAKIIHLCPSSAAAHINSIWNDPASWWTAAEVQRARDVVCAKLAKYDPQPYTTLKNILLH